MPFEPDRDAADFIEMQGIARRDAQALAAFYDHHAPTVFAFLCRMFRDRMEAEDILQETFFQVWREGGKYDPSRGSPVAWLIQIARSRGIDRLRQISLKTKRDGGPIEDWHERLQTEPVAETVLMAEESKAVVDAALSELPPEQREVILRSFFGGQTHHEIARQLEIPLGTIKTRIRLGMEKMQKAIQKRGGCE